MKSKETSQFDVVVLKPRPLICLCRSTATNHVPVKQRRYELLYIDFAADILLYTGNKIGF